MAFWLYSKSADTYTRQTTVQLTGKDGLLATFLKQYAETDTPFAWELNTADLIGLLDPTLNASEHEIVIDMLPEGLTEASLHFVTSIRGVSQYDESDLVLACKILYQGPTGIPAASFKQQFVVDAPAGDREMVEAFRLTGGVATGTYRWAPPKMNIGAAICPAKTEAAANA